MQRWIRIQLHGLDEVFDVTQFRHFYIRTKTSGESYVVGQLIGGEQETSFPTDNPKNPDQAKEVLSAIHKALDPPKQEVTIKEGSDYPLKGNPWHDPYRWPYGQPNVWYSNHEHG